MALSSDRPDGIEPYYRLAFVMDGPCIQHFALLLQQGVTISSRIGCSIGTFLREELGATAGTIEKIQSIILDGKPVDDIESAIVKDGSVLALSAAMPGLVGATLRRGGSYSSFRSAITYHETGEKYSSGEGFVCIKLFNLLMAELGPEILQKGVIISSAGLLSFTAEQFPDFWQQCRQITLDNRLINGPELQDNIQPQGNKFIFLSVSSG
ncbi:MAG: hypothetical protein C0402_13515 [Thermodesulfovibrio sp.]|nr:hypothetical protein [Thermodesulfovibrio sp.]